MGLLFLKHLTHNESGQMAYEVFGTFHTELVQKFNFCIWSTLYLILFWMMDLCFVIACLSTFHIFHAEK